ncbi:acyl-CoA dehydrogenase family protein [Streptomyces doebereineriae]|uniref:Medium-chain specific acyl-CoA dehydrogenase, mitochondrial n=1 Tax=Streptomyces doebereineriae TaxID=3075528 RepID=A0ABU2VB23_9ACTN|nr:acyl-CoA dehydrogenase family protein [Streptomyces sp. DSM 41640]MDT0482753.1 acyl-CoA dehydrogenase family protein [Streptomyces sp. DSM 41640]
MSEPAGEPVIGDPYAFAGQDEFRERVRRLLAQSVLLHAEKWEQGACIPAEGWRTLGEQGLLALGHGGEDFLRSAVFLEELGRTGYAGVRAAVGVHAYMAPSYLELFGTPEQKRRYLPRIRSGELVVALAISEDGAGTDLSGMRTEALSADEAGRYVNGCKWPVVNGTQADLFVTLVRTRQATAGRGLTGASLVLVEGDSPGVIRRPEPMLGMRSADVCRIEFDQVRIAADQLIGRQDRALMYLMKALEFERLVAGLLAVGGVHSCLALLGAHVREHRVGDAPLATKQAVKHRLADLVAEFELVRHFAHRAAWRHSRGDLNSRTASILKLKATELAVEAAQVCVQYHGARGYAEGSAVARHYRDAMAGTIAAGASELMRDMIFEDMSYEL